MSLPKHHYLTISKFITKIVSFFSKLLYYFLFTHLFILKRLNLMPTFYYYLFKVYFFAFLIYLAFLRIVIYIFFNNLYIMIVNNAKIC
jgi:hypothetical protein